MAKPAADCRFFGTSKQTISHHILNILKEGELPEHSVVKNYLTTASDGKQYDLFYYSLEMILAIGYRVRGVRGTQFRQWATRHLSEYLVKGFTMDDERLKNPDGRPDYFDELLLRIRDIRASEKRFYQKHYFNYDLMKHLNGDKQMTDVWHLPAIGRWEKSCGKHPTQKPLSVLTRLIQASTQPGAWILDPFSGSATTGIAANLLGREYLGLEMEEDFLSMSKARREEIDNYAIRKDYLDRLTKAKIILPTNNNSVADDTILMYDIPWI